MLRVCHDSFHPVSIRFPTSSRETAENKEGRHFSFHLVHSHPHKHTHTQSPKYIVDLPVAKSRKNKTKKQNNKKQSTMCPPSTPPSSTVSSRVFEQKTATPRRPSPLNLRAIPDGIDDQDWQSYDQLWPEWRNRRVQNPFALDAPDSPVTLFDCALVFE